MKTEHLFKVFLSSTYDQGAGNSKMRGVDQNTTLLIEGQNNKIVQTQSTE